MKRFKDFLETLKQMLVCEDDFQGTFIYFYDHLAVDDDFFDICKPTKKPFLKKILKSVGERIFDDTGQVTNLFLVRPRKLPFVHGSCYIHGRMANLFYFEDIDMGMLALYSSPSSDVIHFIRITSTSINDADDKNVVMPPPGKPT